MRDDRERLQDILQSIDDIQAFVAGMTESRFVSMETTDRKTYRAVRDCISTLGEAIKHLSPDVTSKHHSVDWPGFSGMRDIVTHQYFQVRLDLLWKTIVDELPALRAIVAAELSPDKDKPTAKP